MTGVPKVKVSVVIATLGGDCLRKTIDCLNQGTLVPSEILICIPEQEAPRVEKLLDKNARVIKTAVRGQVAQRAFGFGVAVGPLVLQLDDDVYLQPSCLAILVENMGEKKSMAVGPKLIDVVTGRSSDFMQNPKDSGLLKRLIFHVANGADGYQAGKISKAAVNMGFSETAINPYLTEWLSGGCLLHRKENLVLDNFYPYAGKAYAEDLYHSYHLRVKGVSLLHCPSAVCEIDVTSSKVSGLSEFVSAMKGFCRSILGFGKLTGRSRSRFLLFFPLYVLHLLIRRYSQRA